MAYSDIEKKYKTYQKGASQRGLLFDLSVEEFGEIVRRPCTYCKAESSTIEGKLNGVDRVNNRMGYFSENVVPCCTMCNMGKSRSSPRVFEAYIERIRGQYNLDPGLGFDEIIRQFEKFLFNEYFEKPGIKPSEKARLMKLSYRQLRYLRKRINKA